MLENDILERLSPRQREAVTYVDGPLLILAGAGSGKTRVLTHKVAWLIAEGLARPWEITAVTFTNKAAGEMRERVSALVPDGADKVWVSTFHAFGLRFLFRNREAVERLTGLRTGFAVLDRGDSRSLVGQIMERLGVNTKDTAPASVLDAISRDWAAWAPGLREPLLEGLYLDIANEYRRALRERNAVDFDDLMVLPLQVLTQDRELREREQARIRWLLVDEFQDVNRPQYLLLRNLVGPDCLLNVVGDPDQSIYGWRGADIGMILNFERDFRGEEGHADAKTIVLDENYRSTGNILAASNALIRNNSTRMKKDLRTSRGMGEKVYTLLANSDLQEADFITAEIARLKAHHGYDYGNIALLYRQNAMSRLYEQKFLELGIPYRIVRGVAFYERREVRDVLALLKLALNPNDLTSFERAAEFAVKGMGPKRREDWATWLASGAVPTSPASDFWGAAAKGAWPVRGQVGAAAAEFAAHMARLLAVSERGIGPAVDYVLNQMGYEELLRSKDPESWEERYDNVMELRSVVPEGGLSEALAEAALFTDADRQDDSENAVGLLTLHAAKGLEFPVVFLVGMEEDVFPSSRAKDQPDQLEEERRLCYVGMTRAEERLYLTAARSRRLYGTTLSKGFSRFIYEVPEQYREIDDRAGEGRGWDEGYGSGGRRRSYGGYGKGYRPYGGRWGG